MNLSNYVSSSTRQTQRHGKHGYRRDYFTRSPQIVYCWSALRCPITVSSAIARTLFDVPPTQKAATDFQRAAQAMQKLL